MNLFERATTVPQNARWINAFVNVSGIVFMNFNLLINSMGFYQLSKLCCIPVIVLANYVIYSKKTPFRTLCCLAVLLCGIALFSVNDVTINLLGSIYAVIAVCFTTASQMSTNVYSNRFQVFGSAMQHITAIPMIVFAGISTLCLETFGEKSFLKHDYQPVEIILILLTGLLAVGANIAAFALIGKTSAVTYQVVGHAKTILIFAIGLIFIDRNDGATKEQTIKKIIGLLFGLGGTITYTVFELDDKKRERLQKEITKREEEDHLETLLNNSEDDNVLTNETFPESDKKLEDVENE